MRYIGRRLVIYAVTLWAAISLNFFLPRLLPGDPAAILIAKMSRNGDVTDAQLQSIRRLFGNPEASLWTQYIEYWQQLFRGDLGTSVSFYPTPVTELIGAALPWSIGLVGMATIISFTVGIGLGMFAGWKRGTWVDHIVPSTTLLQSLPYFWVAMVLIYFFSVQNQWFPIIGGYNVFMFNGPEWSWDFVGSVAYHAVLPATTIVISSVGGWLLGMRNMMVSTLGEDFVVTAEAKGLKKRRIMTTYAARNAMLPSIAGFGVALGFVVGGFVVMETVFSYPGIGKLMITAVRGNDYALMQGVFLVITLTVLVAMFITDMIYGLIDPRARQNV
ncbi:ABC transporter permease [Demequina sp. B12]|uniref:ABC transporter permease n=1 Tax=Demequina sp. B12 TaxID=2992757 RepID=UPI00237A8274|nr:ABC transporter permease [Demequina sp. B12]MDE0571939.1 ABC transporter permease [Demequina sp. B12]